jgi:hypothetical protein
MGGAGVAVSATVPPFAAYFSVAPTVYPLLAALADSVGELAALRGSRGSHTGQYEHAP